MRDLSMQGRKRALRLELAALDPPSNEVAERVLSHLGTWLTERGPGVVVGFLAMTGEVDMTPLVSRFPDIEFALTRTAPGVSLTVHPFDARRETHRFGFEQPAEDAGQISRDDVDVVLVPGLAFGGDGRRLGRGAGYYDRFLAGLTASTVALTTNARIRDDLPVEPHDVLIDWIATETGVTPTRR